VLQSPTTNPAITKNAIIAEAAIYK